MKFSKSILIFLFLSPVSGTFYYALKRTNGNVFKSLQFALFFLAIQMDLIGLNLPPKLDQDQSIQQPVSRVVYNPYVSFFDDYRPSGLLMNSIERSSSVPQYSYSQNAINELRAVDSRVRKAAWLLIAIWMLQQQSVGFQPVRPVARPPHVEATHNLLFGKPKSDGQSRLHLSNSNKISTNVMPTQIQVVKFVKKDASIDLQQAFDEVNRRVSVIGCGNFDYSFGRFEGLATECGEPDTGSTRKALTILKGEMRGYYRNARREDYGLNVTGLDFVVEGLGEFDHITHVEVKSAVSSSIQLKPTLIKQAKKYVNRVNGLQKIY